MDDNKINVGKKKKQNDGEVVIRDSETSNALEALKSKEIDNKPKVETSEDKDVKIQESTNVDSTIERYVDVDYTEGLNDDQVNKRIEQGLINDNNSDKGKTITQIVLSNIFTFFKILYFVIAIILIILRDYMNLFFLGVVLANLSIGIFQEIRAKKTIEKMKIVSAPSAVVIRNGKKLEIPVKEVVLDDIIMFSSGKQICADCIVLDGNVEVNEALLTGEADAIPKVPGDKLFSGSFLSSGTCIARADKVGSDCFIEKLSQDAKVYSAPRSELLRTLRIIIKTISFIIFPIAILYIVSRIQGEFTLDAFLEALPEGLKSSSYIILTMIPGGLFLLTSVALYLGVYKLSKSNTLVQELYCIEMLARVDTLCLDKTGTITDGTMRVCDCVEINNNTDYTIREIVGSMMNAFKETNPTSDALIKYFEKNDVLSPTEVIPFSSKRKYSAVTFGEEGTFIIGAPDFVIKDNYDKISAKVTRFSNQGCRVLVLGRVYHRLASETLPKNVNPIALIVIQDHIREDAADTISFFKQNGVDVKVISGDNPETVSKIADRVGIEHADRWINLNGLTDEEIQSKVFEYTVFGRVTPSQKKLIVKTLKSAGRIVAMTGDGVNDIPALKEADCSIAMASGSEATRYVSHLVLMDSNFSSMPKVVKEGRRVINNIQKTSALYLTKNLFAMLLAIMYIIIGFAATKNAIEGNINFPFEARNLAIIEYIIIGIGTTALAFLPNDQIIKGKFLSNVVKNILPGSLVILLYQLIIFFSQRIMINGEYLFPVIRDVNFNVYSTMSTIITTAIMFAVYVDVCRPVKGIRKLFIAIVVALTAVMILVEPLRNYLLLSFNELSGTEWLLMIILIQSIYPLMLGIKYVLKILHIVPNTKD